MNDSALKAQIKAAAYALVVQRGPDRAMDILREVVAEIAKDNRQGSGNASGGSGHHNDVFAC